jgi:putative ABC transport system permease protein
LFIQDEFSFDQMFTDADRIYRINIDNRTNGEYSQYAVAPGPMAGVIDEDCPQIELVTRFRTVGSTLIRTPEAKLNIKEAHVIGVDSSFFEMFGLGLLKGNVKTALVAPNSLVLTASAVADHFGQEEALGKSLLLDNKNVYVVTGVIADMPENSFLRNHTVFTSLSSYEDAETIAWNSWNFPTFVKLQKGTDVADFQAFLNTVKESYLIPWAMTFIPGMTIESARASDESTGNFMKFNTTALTDIHLYSSNRRGEFSPNSDIQNVYILSFIGFFLILLAVVNFMNLSTAHSLKRAKEVGIRKTLGSNRFGLIRQFLIESGLISLLSLFFAIVLAFVAMPFFNELSGKTISIPFDRMIFWLTLLASTLILSLIAGTYPALVLSKFSPVKALKGGSKDEVGKGNIRNVLVVFQFAISVFLIISTLVVFQQVRFIQHKDLGFQKDQILIVDDIYAAGSQLEPLKHEVKQLAQVEEVSLSSYLPTPSARNGITYFAEGGIEDGAINPEQALIIGNWKIDFDYVSTLGLKIIAGRNFDRSFATDSSGLILNESAVAMLDVSPEEAIGMRLTNDIHRQDKENMEYVTVIGVVENFHFESLRNDIDALSLILGDNSDKMMIKLNAGNFAGTIDQIEEIWHDMAPGQPFDYYFMDESFNDTYQAELRLGSIFITFTLLSIFIACLGLFGLAAFNAEKRSKEIGVRKVLGASVSQITYKLSADFLKLVFISILISVPLGWYAMNKWLENFSFRIDISWWVFAAAGLLAIAISILTVSYQSIKAAIVNPVKSLKSE